MGNALVIDKLPCIASFIRHGLAFLQKEKLNEISPDTREI